MKIYLVRHGNTFESNQTPICLGRNEDLALTEYGRSQADLLGRYFKNIQIDKIITASLLRTEATGKIILTYLSKTEFEVNSDLNEFDYGIWSGKTSNQILAIDQKSYELWDQQSIYPLNANWVPSEAEVIIKLEKIIKENLQLNYKNIVLVSSNGILRYFLKIIPGAFNQAVMHKTFKMSTGAISCLEVEADYNKLVFWNKLPQQLSLENQ